MMEVIELIKLITSCLLVLFTLITIILKVFKHSSSKKVAASADNVLKLIEKAKEFIIIAEGIINFKGTDRKEWVMTKLEKFAIDNDIKFLEEEASKIVEDLIDFSKKVNIKEEVL